jgi:lysine/ornithine N-monooxygenase
VLSAQAADGLTHSVDNVILAQGYSGAESNLFEQMSVFIHRCNAQVGSAKIDANREIRHKQISQTNITNFRLPIDNSSQSRRTQS